MEVKPGYNKVNLTEPLILEPEDWTNDEWTTLCKLCGLSSNSTERIVLRVESMEFFTKEN